MVVAVALAVVIIVMLEANVMTIELINKNGRTKQFDSNMNGSSNRAGTIHKTSAFLKIPKFSTFPTFPRV